MATKLLGECGVIKDIQQEEDLSIPSYFWDRKRAETLKMLNRNLKSIFPESDSFYQFVDFGTGRGEDLLMLYEGIEQKIRSRIFFCGVDAIKERLESLRQVLEQKKISDIKIVLHDISQRLPFEDESVDFVYSSEVVEHLLSPESFFAEIRRVLKKNGYFLLTTMNQPNFLEKEYWCNKFGFSSGKKKPEEIPYEEVVIDGKAVQIHGHISLRPTADWDACLNQEGFHLVDVARGALRYALPAKLNRLSIVKYLLFFLEAFLDIFPRKWTRGFSCQTIGLYQLKSI